MEWKEVKVADIADLKNGKKRPSSKGDIPVYGGNGIMDYVDVSNGYNNIIIGRVGAYCGCVYRCFEHCWISDNAIAAKAKNGNDTDYIFYLLKGLNLNHHHIGGAQPLMTQDLIGRIEVMVPQRECDQRRIAAILSSLDRKIELNNKINAQLEEMAQAIFKNWFVDFEPFKDGKFVESELGMIPEGWRVGSPYEYIKVVYGAPYKSSKFNDKGVGLPLIRIRDLKDCNPQFFTPEILPQTEYVERGEILAGMDAEFLPYIWKGNRGLLNQRVCKLKPVKKTISNLYALYLLKPELEFVQSYKTGTTVSHLGKADIDKFKVIIPPLEIVESCSKLLDSILNRICNLSKESLHLAQLRDTLLPKLMSSEIIL